MQNLTVGNRSLLSSIGLRVLPPWLQHRGKTMITPNELDMVGMGGDNLSEEEQTRLRELLIINAGISALNQSELGTTNIVTHAVNTGDHSPICQHPRRTPLALCNKVNEMVNDMLNNQVIQLSISPWGSPIVPIEKKNGSFCFCVDCCCLNSITKMDVFPLLRIEDTLDLLANSKFFTTLGVLASSNGGRFL